MPRDSEGNRSDDSADAKDFDPAIACCWPEHYV